MCRRSYCESALAIEMKKKKNNNNNNNNNNNSNNNNKHPSLSSTRMLI